MKVTVTPYAYARYLLLSGQVGWETSNIYVYAGLIDTQSMDPMYGGDFQIARTTFNAWNRFTLQGRAVRYNTTTHLCELCSPVLSLTPVADGITAGVGTGMIFAVVPLSGAYLVRPLAKLLLESDAAGAVVAGTQYAVRPANSIIFTL